jgi:hypothetical protein
MAKRKNPSLKARVRQLEAQVLRLEEENLKSREQVQKLIGEVQTLKTRLGWAYLGLAIVGAILLAIIIGAVIYLLSGRQKRKNEERDPRLVALAELLQDLFKSRELVLFIHRTLGQEGREITRYLPRMWFYSSRVFEIVAALHRRGIPENFFDNLVALRPEREVDIREIQKKAA